MYTSLFLISSENCFIRQWNIHLSLLFFILFLTQCCLQIQEDGMPNASSKKQSEKDEDVSFPAEEAAIEMENQPNAAPDQEVWELLWKMKSVLIYFNRPCLSDIQFMKF